MKKRNRSCVIKIYRFFVLLQKLTTQETQRLRKKFYRFSLIFVVRIQVVFGFLMTIKLLTWTRINSFYITEMPKKCLSICQIFLTVSNLWGKKVTTRTISNGMAFICENRFYLKCKRILCFKHRIYNFHFVFIHIKYLIVTNRI